MKNVKWMWLVSVLVMACTANGGDDGPDDDDDDDDEEEVCNNNNVCSGPETSANCPADCGECGDKTCDAGETQQSCATDCTPAEACGNNVCTAGETATSCAADCTAQIRFTNNSSYSMYYLFFRQCSSSEWSTNLLQGTYMGVGQSYLVTTIPFGCWVMRLENSGRTRFWETSRDFTNDSTQQLNLTN